MTSVDKALSSFSEAVTSGASIAVSNDGSWDVRWEITRLFRWVLGFEKQDTLQVARYFRNYLKTYELRSSKELKGLYSTSHTDSDIRQAAEAIKARLMSYINNEFRDIQSLKEKKYTIRNMLKSCATDEKGALEVELNQTKISIRTKKIEAVATNQFNKIQKLLNAKAARETEQSIIHSHKESEDDVTYLRNKLIKWKKIQFPKLSEELSDEEELKIRQTTHYKDQNLQIRYDRIFREHYFRFVFKNSIGGCKDAVDIAMQFPTLQKHYISEAFLDKRVQRLNNKGLIFEEDLSSGKAMKDLKIMIDTKYHSIIDLTKPVEFKYMDGDKEVAASHPLHEVFRSFQRKNIDAMGDFEYTMNGISLMFPQHTKLDLSKEDWATKLPVLEVVSKEELEKRYNQKYDGKSSILVIKANREKIILNIQNNHGWCNLCTPRGDGSYNIHSIGMYAEEYPPTSLLESFFYIFGTLQATISLVDESEYLNNREHIAVAKELSVDQNQRFLEKLKTSLLDARAGISSFQAQGTNCSSWIQGMVDYTFKDIKIPRLFDIELLDTSAPQPLQNLVSGLRWLRDTISPTVANITRLAISILSGAWKSRVFTRDGVVVNERLLDYAPWRSGLLSLPAKFFFTAGELKKALGLS